MRVALHHGPAALVLAGLPAGSVDMVYSDPPFGTGKVWTGRAGSFNDRFTWDEAAYQRLLAERPIFAAIIKAAPIPLHQRAYLVAMAELFAGCHRVLRAAGSLWLHCDDTMSHYLRVVLDQVFGPTAFLGQVIWRRTGSHTGNKRSFGRVHDSILVFARSRVARWRLWRLRSAFVHGDPCDALWVDGLAETDRLNAKAAERADYPTQKPVALLTEIVRAGCLPGGTVLDPTCGSGTTLVAARQAGCAAIGIDLSADAIALCRKRLHVPTKAQSDVFGGLRHAA